MEIPQWKNSVEYTYQKWFIGMITVCVGCTLKKYVSGAWFIRCLIVVFAGDSSHFISKDMQTRSNQTYQGHICSTALKSKEF